MFRDFIFFLQGFFKNPTKVGSVIPSTRYLAQEITRYIDDTPHKHFLEVGAGTGALTDAILEKMDASSYLDLVERDKEYCEHLKEKYKNSHNVTVVNATLLDWNPPYCYDGIISSLPLNAFQPEINAGIFEKFHNLITPEGILSFYEYAAIPKIKKLSPRKQNRKQYKRTLELIQAFCDRYQIDQNMIWSNFPPSRVHHLRLTDEK